jgi:hypothetical protein
MSAYFGRFLRTSIKLVIKTYNDLEEKIIAEYPAGS